MRFWPLAHLFCPHLPERSAIRMIPIGRPRLFGCSYCGLEAVSSTKGNAREDIRDHQLGRCEAFAAHLEARVQGPETLH